MQMIAAVLPFRWMVAFPVELLSGRLTPVQTVQGIATQVLWLVLAILLCSMVWRIGIRRYEAVGG
jgi:ABC-2 type transport system permease protein